MVEAEEGKVVDNRKDLGEEVEGLHMDYKDSPHMGFLHKDYHHKDFHRVDFRRD